MNVVITDDFKWTWHDVDNGFRFVEDYVEVLESKSTVLSYYLLNRLVTVEEISDNEIIVTNEQLGFSLSGYGKKDINKRRVKNHIILDPERSACPITVRVDCQDEDWWGKDIESPMHMMDGPHNNRPSLGIAFAAKYQGLNVAKLVDNTIIVLHPSLGWIPYNYTKGKGLSAETREEYKMLKRLF